MKTKTLLFLLLLCVTSVISAQETKGYETNFQKNKAFDNWFIQGGAGMAALFGDENKNADFKDRLNANPHLAVGKFFNPHWGIRAYLTGGNLHGFVGNNAQLMQHNNYIAGHLDFMYDVLNHWCVYKEDRFFRIIPWAGAGYAHRYKNQGFARSRNFTINAGLLTAFRISDRIDFNIELQGILVPETFNRQTMGTAWDGIGQLSAGLTFKLGKPNFNVLVPMDKDLVNNLNGRINDLLAENDRLAKRPVSCPDIPECPECPEVSTVVKASGHEKHFVHFKLGSTAIDPAQEITVFTAAQTAKQTGNVVKVVGFADKKTGTEAINKQISEARANNVAKLLKEKFGVPASQVVVEAEGADMQLFEENDWNRLVTLTIDY